MALSDFVNKEIASIETRMRRLAHNTMMGDVGSEEQVLIAFGKYRQLKSDRDRWLELKKKSDAPSEMEDMPEDDDEQLPPAEPERAVRRPRPRNWGG